VSTKSAWDADSSDDLVGIGVQTKGLGMSVVCSTKRFVGA
jgi:hypothetical protein